MSDKKKQKDSTDDYNVEVTNISAVENQQNQIAEVTDSKSMSKRAEQILNSLNQDKTKASSDMINQVKKGSQRARITYYGREKLAAGPSLRKSKKIILVEGRADVINLLKMGIENTVALGGTNVPKSILHLTKKKEVTAFLDGDRGGDSILKELLLRARIDYVSRAPKGKEIEHLDYEEVQKALTGGKTPIKDAEFIGDNMSMIDFLKKHNIYKFHK